MKISAVECHHYCLFLRAAWMTAAGTFARREGFLLRITTDDKRYGFGDCAPLAEIGSHALAAEKTALRTVTKKFIGMQVADALKELPAPFKFNAPAARCALEMALLDLLAQAGKVPLARYLRGNTLSGMLSNEIVVNAAPGSLMHVSEQAIVAACSEGFSVLKLKVGTAPLEQELARLQCITGLLPPGTLLRLDANRAWQTEDAARFLDACAGLPIEMIEEPLADPQIDTLQYLQATCAFPLALDESLTNFDLDALCAAPPVRRLVLKPPRLGGLLPALAVARRAAAAGMQCVVTSSVDSACGVFGAAHLAATLDNGLAHGLATSSWLAADTGTPPAVSNGQLALPDIPGLGFVANNALVFSGMGSQSTRKCEPPRHKGHQETPS
jgi:o-succinylbenzoate synthase